MNSSLRTNSQGLSIFLALLTVGSLFLPAQTLGAENTTTDTTNVVYKYTRWVVSEYVNFKIYDSSTAATYFDSLQSLNQMMLKRNVKSDTIWISRTLEVQAYLYSYMLPNNEMRNDLVYQLYLDMLQNSCGYTPREAEIFAKREPWMKTQYDRAVSKVECDKKGKGGPLGLIAKIAAAGGAVVGAIIILTGGCDDTALGSPPLPPPSGP